MFYFIKAKYKEKITKKPSMIYIIGTKITKNQNKTIPIFNGYFPTCTKVDSTMTVTL